MSRVVKEYAVRRDEILDAAERLIYTRGYEQMSIQDILDTLQIAKGTFYYYFDAKQALLKAITDRMLEKIEGIVTPVVENPEMNALAKLQQFFRTITRWETGQKTLVLALLRVWYTDDNTIVREKVRVETVRRLAPLLAAIVRQGAADGTLDPASVDKIGEVVLVLLMGMEDALGGLLLSSESDQDALQGVRSALAAYSSSLERVLGVPPRSLVLIDPDSLEKWFASSSDG